jgi:DNA-binding response OmpR family regulator
MNMTPADKHILLIEDSDTQALKFMILLEDEGWTVSRAATAEEGLEFLNQLIPDLIVVDYFLPGMHGDAFCRQVRMKAATRHVPLLMLTAADSSATEVQGLDSGADDYLPKSEDFEVLRLRIHALLRKASGQISFVPETAFQQARILAVDDSPTYLAYLVAELQQEGYLVDQAESGELALAKLEQGDYDCVLVDLVMPGIDGIEVCQRLSTISQQRLSPILVLMLTAHDNAVELSRALAAGADDFVGKSSDGSVLKGRVRALLRRKLSQDENQRLMKEIIYAKEQEARHARKAQEEAEARAALSEELAVALKKVQSSKEELEQLAYISAHDLQEPLRLLTNYTQLLVQRLPADLAPKSQRYVDFINQNTQRMQRQLRSLLEYLSVSTEALKLQEINPESIVTELFEQLVHLHPQAQLEISQPLPVLPVSVYHFKLLIKHLLQNGLQFCKPDCTPELRFWAQEKESEWVLALQDNGLGVDSLFFKRIFQIFQQLDSGQKHLRSGMGLALCRRIVELHQGAIWLESELGQGSTFFFSLPKARQEAF